MWRLPKKKRDLKTWFSDREYEVLKTIARFDSVNTAAHELNLAPSTLYSVIYRAREKISKSRVTVNQTNNFRQRSRALARLLVPYMKITITSEMVPDDGDLMG